MEEVESLSLLSPQPHSIELQPTDAETLRSKVIELEARETEYLRAFERIAHGSYTDPETPRAIARTILTRPQQDKT